MLTEAPKILVSLDFDGPLITRELFGFPTNFQYSEEARLVRSRDIYPYPPDSLPSTDRTVRKMRIPFFKIPSYIGNKLRGVIPEAGQAVIDYARKGVVFDGNTGRWATESYVGITEKALQSFHENDLEPFNLRDAIRDIYYKPYGWRSSLSKAIALQEMKEKAKKLGSVKIFHVEDNLADGVFVARAHPDVTVIIIEDRSTQRLKEKMPLGISNVVFARNMREGLDKNIGPLLTE